MYGVYIEYSRIPMSPSKRCLLSSYNFFLTAIVVVVVVLVG